MELRITVRVVNVYGKETVYPVCHTAQLLCKLAGKRTITTDMLAVIEALGYQVQVQRPSLPVGV